MTDVDKKAVSHCHALACRIRRAIPQIGDHFAADEAAKGEPKTLVQALIAELNGMVRRERMRLKRRASRKIWSRI